MRYFIKYLNRSLIAGFILVSACTDLSQTPYSEITTKNFNATSKDITSLIAPVYTPLRGVMGFHTYLSSQESPTDETVTPRRPNGWYDGGRYWRMHRHTWTPTDATPSSPYNMSFDGINAANRVLENIQNGTYPIKEGKESLLAELKVARAFYYLILLDNYKNVPIVKKFSISAPPEQNNAMQVYQFVEQQLKNNIPKLTEKADQSTYGRFNKWAGKTALAHLYLNSKSYIGKERFQKVIAITQEIIDSGEYQLADNYKANFTRNNQTSPEIILAVPYDEVNAPGNSWHLSTITPQQKSEYHMKVQPWGGASAQPQFINTYDEDDQRLEDTWIKGPQYDDQGNEVIDLKKNVPSIKETDMQDGYRLGKYEIYDGINTNSDVDFPFYRYAGVLMMKAEALLRTGHANEAAQIVTKVRMRDFDNPSNAKITGAELKQDSKEVYGLWQKDGTIKNPHQGDIEFGRMLDELGWEFAYEAHRRDDFLRFGVFTTETWFNHRPNGDFTKLYPIPKTTLNTNANLKQNPGY